MIEFWNVVIAAVAGMILGATIHSDWLHSKKRGESAKENDDGTGARPKRRHPSPEASRDAP